MKKKSILKRLAAAALTGGLLAAAPSSQAQGPAAAVPQAACFGKIFNPISDTDWNNLYPITVMGVSTGGGVNPPLMYEPPVCVCPGIFGIPSPGVGITYWQPLYLAEIQRTPGCMSSLGGLTALSGYATQQSEQVNESKDGGPVSRMNIHWYEYPIFAIMDLFKSLGCRSPSGFNLMYVTEPDPTWHDDMWAAIFSPESLLFSNPIAQGACAIDAVAANVAFPIDALFWCAGSWGAVYPFSGNGSHTNSNFTANNLILSKFIARQSRVGLGWATIGPEALCTSVPSPVWVKSQYRVDQVGPIPRYGKPVVIGSMGLLQMPPIANLPTQESTVDLIWQGQQCCLRTY